MLSQSELTQISYLMSARFEAINTHYIKSMANQIKKIGKLTPSNLKRLEQMTEMGQNVAEINNMLAQASDVTLKELFDIYDASGMELYNNSAYMYLAKGIKQVPFKDNTRIQNYINSVKQQTYGSFFNISHTTVVSEQYRNLIDTAIDTVANGLSDYNSVMWNQLEGAALQGTSVTYASGITRRADSAVRMNILEGVRRINEGVRNAVAEEVGTDGFEITAHSLCAKDHIDIQGRQYASGDDDKTVDGKTYPSYNQMNESLKRHIGTCNCKHSAIPIILGISEPAYRDEQLQEYKALSEEEVTLTTGYRKDGTPITKKCTRYEATQYQRNLETEMRRQKDAQIAAKTLGNNEAESVVNARLRTLRSTYRRISEEARLTPKWDRTFVPGYTRKQTTPKPITI